MTPEEHGRRLSQRMAALGADRVTVASLVGVNTRTLANWMRGATMPAAEYYTALHYYLGDYDGASE